MCEAIAGEGFVEKTALVLSMNCSDVYYFIENDKVAMTEMRTTGVELKTSRGACTASVKSAESVRRLAV